MKRVTNRSILARVLFGAVLASWAAGIAQAQTLTMTTPASNTTVNVPAGSGVYTVSFTITSTTDTYTPTGGSLSNTVNGNPNYIATFQATDFVQDPNDSTKWTVSLNCSSGTQTRLSDLKPRPIACEAGS